LNVLTTTTVGAVLPQFIDNYGKDKKIDLKVRVYECPECGMIKDRDLNAAINIKNRGTKIIF